MKEKAEVKKGNKEVTNSSKMKPGHEGKKDVHGSTPIHDKEQASGGKEISLTNLK